MQVFRFSNISSFSGQTDFTLGGMYKRHRNMSKSKLNASLLNFSQIKIFEDFIL